MLGEADHLAPLFRVALSALLCAPRRPLSSRRLLPQASLHPGFLCWKYASRLVASGIFFLVACYLNALATMVSTHRNPYAMLLDRAGEPLAVHTLPDLGHDLWAFALNR